MKLSKESQAGLVGMLALAHPSSDPITSVAQVASMTGLAQPFLAKVFQRLARGGILRAYRGRSRGYALARPAASISLQEVLETIEGPQVFHHCVFWSDTCSETHPCVLHDIWKTVAERSRAVMAETTVADLVRFNESRRTSAMAESDAALLDLDSITADVLSARDR